MQKLYLIFGQNRFYGIQKVPIKKEFTPFSLVFRQFLTSFIFFLIPCLWFFFPKILDYFIGIISFSSLIFQTRFAFVAKKIPIILSEPFGIFFLKKQFEFFFPVCVVFNSLKNEYMNPNSKNILQKKFILIYF